MITFFHTADAHFGVENYGKIDPKTGLHSRLMDFVASFESCVDQAIEQDVDFFLFCGDAYKTAYPTPTQQKQCLRLLFKLQQHGIKVVIVVGNHDHPLSFGKSHALDVFTTVPLDGLYVFSKPGFVVIETKHGPVQIVGIPWPLRHNIITKQAHRFKSTQDISAYISEKVGMIIQELAQKLDPSIPAVLAGHLTVSTGIFSGSEKCAVYGNDPLFLPSQLAIQPFDYVALGHLHRYQNLNPRGIPVVYAGSPERVDFGERKESKGFCRVQLDATKDWGSRCSYTFEKLATRPMIQIEVTLERDKDQTAQLLEQIQQHDIKDAIVKIIYHVPEGCPHTVHTVEVQRACAAAMHVASITPVIKRSTREGRVSFATGMDFETMVDAYLQLKQDAPVNHERVRRKALELYTKREEP